MPSGADMGILRRRDGEAYQLAATYGLKPEWRDLIALHPNMPGRHSINWTGLASVSCSSVECVCLFEQPHGLRRIVATLF